MQRRTFLTTMTRAVLGGIGGLAMASHSSSATTMHSTRPIRLLLAGDVMTGRGIDQILRRPSDPVLYESYVRDARDYVALAERRHGPIPRGVAADYPWHDALDAIATERPDAHIVNLETSITTHDSPWPGKPIHYRMHPENVDCLTAARIDCCTLANNHVLDWGRSGLDETLRTLSAAGIDVAGAGADFDAAWRPVRLRLSSATDVLIVACADVSSGVPKTWAAGKRRSGVALLDDLSDASLGWLGRLIDQHRQAGDVVVLSIHWGSNWGYGVPAAQRRFARALVDGGIVDIVFGHSSHHARPIEYRNGRLILYGCGDLLNDYEGIGGHRRYRPELVAAYRVTLSGLPPRPSRLELLPFRLSGFRLNAPGDDDIDWMLKRLNDVSGEYATRIARRDATLVAVPAP